MKRLKPFLLLTLALSILLTLSACKKTNEEYLEYRDKLSGVLESNGVSVNREMDTSRRAQRKTDNVIKDILHLADQAEQKAESGVESYYSDAFETAFYIPLILGDAITVSHKAKDFYGVCIKSPSPQWFITEKQGEALVTSIYTQTNHDGVYIVLKLDYQSQDNYRFYCYQYTSDMQNRLFIYGDNNGEFVFLRYQTGTEKEAFVLTRRAGQEKGNLVSDEQVVKSAMALVADDFTAFDNAKIKGLSSRADYTISEAEYKEAQMRVFPEALEKDKGALYNVNGSEMVCHGYGAENEAVVTLPEGVLLGSDINVYDYSGDVKELVFPADMRFTDEAETYFANGGGLGVRLYRVYSDGSTDEHVFEKITVKQGNSHLKAIQGNLYDQSGEMLLYLSDNPDATSIRLSFTKVPLNGVAGIGKRKHLGKLQSFDYPLISFENNDRFPMPYNLFEQMILGAGGNGSTYPLHLSALTVRGVVDRYDIGDFYTADSQIEKLVLYGDFETVLIQDECGLVRDVKLCSSISNASIHKRSTLPSYTLSIQLYITEDNQWIDLGGFEKVTAVTIAPEVERVNLDQFSLDGEDEIDIYLTNDLQYISLPNIKTAPSDKYPNGHGWVLGNYRLHFPCSSSQYDSFLENKPELKNTLKTPYVKIFTDTNMEDIARLLETYRISFGDNGLVIHNYYGTEDVISFPREVWGLPIIGICFDGQSHNGQTPQMGYISEIHLHSGIKWIRLLDKNLGEPYHFGKVVYEGSYSAFTYLSIEYDTENPYVGMLERFTERYDLLVTDDKILSPLDKVYNLYVSFGAYTPTNMLLSYKHAEESYTFTADFLGAKVQGVLDENGHCTMNVTVDGRVYTFVFTHDGIIIEPGLGIQLRKFTLTLTLPDGTEYFEEILDDRV